MNNTHYSKSRIRQSVFAKLGLAALLLVGAVSATALPASAATTSCYTGTTKVDAKALAGNTIGTIRTVGKWCVTSGKVTSATYLDGWAETSTIGWSASSHLGKGSGVASGQGRVWERGKLFFGTTWAQIQEVSKCPRVKGTSTGKNVGDDYCSIY